MCTRYTLHRGKATVEAAAKALGVLLRGTEAVQPDYNVALTRQAPVIAGKAEAPALRAMTWGFLPFYERSRAPARLLANARCETVASLPSFKEAFASRRCLVPADGFYEWSQAGSERIPHLFTLAGDEPFAFAGIWEPGCNGEMDTFAVLTTAPNALVAPVHDRMPVILRAHDMPRWLAGEGPLDRATSEVLFTPLPVEALRCRALDSFVSSVRNNGPRCHAPRSEPAQGELF